MIIAMVTVVLRFGVPGIWPGFEGFRVAFISGLAGALALVVWWLFERRLRAVERWSAVGLGILALTLTAWLNHPSMGLMWLVYHGIPVLALMMAGWALFVHRLSARGRRVAGVGVLVLATLPWTLVRMDGLTGDHVFEFSTRWGGEVDRVAQAEPMAKASSIEKSRSLEKAVTWPGFRGPNRDGTVAGTELDLDWSRMPPTVLWRRSAGPGWSSFAVEDGRVFTQEQHGEEERVTCYALATGESLWWHADPARFYESMGGAGPRATPTVADGTVYTLGATGILNALAVDDGTMVWSRDVAADTGSRVPMWGFAGSPLIERELVIVAAGGRLIAYDRTDGTPRWRGPDGGVSYSSPHRAVLDGATHIVLLSDLGAVGVDPRDGHELWSHVWSGTSLVQPASIASGDLLISAGEGRGVRRIALRRDAGVWVTETRWTTNRLKPNFNDFVVHGDHAYGFDGRMLAAIDLEDGSRVWKGGRYGHGQMLLLADRDLLLVLAEDGDLALVDALPHAFNERARVSGIEGKTWNHPVLAGDILLIRNRQESAAFRLKSKPFRARISEP